MRFGDDQRVRYVGAATIVRDIAEAVDGPDDGAGLVAHDVDVGHRDDARAVRPLDHDLLRSRADAGLERLGHRVFGTGQRRAVRQTQPHRAAEACAGTADRGLAAPELGRAAIEVDDPPLAITQINADGQAIQEVGRQIGPAPDTERPEQTFSGRNVRGNSHQNAHIGRGSLRRSHQDTRQLSPAVHEIYQRLRPLYIATAR